MSRIVAFTGKAGAGKSTAAAYLCEKHGYARTRFAGPLKAMLRALYAGRLPPDEIERRIEGDLKEAPDPLLCGKTPRHAMQTLGTEWGRDLIGQGLWTGLWADTVSGNCRYVVEDCRFPNEGGVIADMGGVIVAIVCPWAGLNDGHSSEHMAVTPHFTVDNAVYGDPKWMFDEIDEILGL